MSKIACFCKNKSFHVEFDDNSDVIVICTECKRKERLTDSQEKLNKIEKFCNEVFGEN